MSVIVLRNRRASGFFRWKELRPMIMAFLLAAGGLLDVAAELVAHRREHLLGKGVRLARAEARIEGGGEDVAGDGLLDRRHDRPPPLAGVRHDASVVRERRVLGQRLRREVEEPGADDGAAAPQLRDVRDVEVVPQLLRQVLRARVLEDVEPLRVRLHQTVLDPVVDHLDEMAGTRGPAVEVAVLRGFALRLAPWRARDGPHPGSERPKDRIEALDNRPVAADHEAVTALEPPDAAARADIDVVYPPLAERPAPAHVVLEVGVAAVDERVAGTEPPGEVHHDLLGRRTRRHHHPRDAGRRELRHEVVERHGADRALARELLDDLRVPRPRDDLVATPHEPTRHVPAHPSQAHHPDLHDVRPPHRVPLSVESSTSTSGNPAIRPNVSFSPPGQRLEPPTPSRSARVKPPRRTPSATRRRRPMRPTWPSA